MANEFGCRVCGRMDSGFMVSGIIDLGFRMSGIMVSKPITVRIRGSDS